MRRAGRVLLVIAALVLVGLAVVVVTGRAHLADQRNTVDNRWDALREPLTQRYLSLGEMAALALEVGGERDVITETQVAIDRWRETGASGRSARDPEAEVRLANELEGLGARLVRTVRVSPRLEPNEDLQNAADGYALTVPRDTLIDGYDRAVRRYESDRDSLRYRPSATLFGFGPRTAFEPSGEVLAGTSG